MTDAVVLSLTYRIILMGYRHGTFLDIFYTEFCVDYKKLGNMNDFEEIAITKSLMSTFRRISKWGSQRLKMVFILKMFILEKYT